MRNGEFIRSLYDAFARGDAATVLGAFDPQIEWLEAPGTPYADRNPYRGPQAVGEGVFGRLMQDWTTFRLFPEQVVDGGDTVVVLGHYEGVNKATARALNAPFAHAWWLRNGKIVRFQQYTDTAAWNQAAR